MRDQAGLLLVSVDDYMTTDNPVRFIGAFVDDLNLVGIGFVRAQPKETERPSYAPADMLKR